MAFAPTDTLFDSVLDFLASTPDAGTNHRLPTARSLAAAIERTARAKPNPAA